ncbi:DUF7848 domain-containing protein [Streptomyces halobius]|uniref:DUF7848 domain-containing protein n=1 Tax=Streptomyces halobius TaxID=2879846 RepID=A0ABY4M2H2_9ACTN|nr:hypothetical protein [Streptomyces halobius]UQA91657.1 hypothetical protein K9S39_07080 [Streptomyces halobius]
MSNEITPANLPDIGSNEPVVTFVMLECRTCGEHSGWVRSDDQMAPAWDGGHFTSTGHTRFYLWSVTRNTAQVSTFKARKRGKR